MNYMYRPVLADKIIKPKRQRPKGQNVRESNFQAKALDTDSVTELAARLSHMDKPELMLKTLLFLNDLNTKVHNTQCLAWHKLG